MAAPPPPPPPSATRDTNTSHGSASRANDTTVGDDDVQEMKKLLATVLKDRTADGGAVAKTTSSVPGETCTWYANKQCNAARTCYDCLNTRLAGNTQICMVDNYGACVSMSQYASDKDFRRPRPPNGLGSSANVYPSTNATYCANDDKYCSICKNNWGNPFDNSKLSYLPFCRGVGGCVCIQACESPYHNDNVVMQRCQILGYSAPSAATIYTSIGFMAALCCFAAIATLIVRRWLRHKRAHQRPALRHDQPLPPRVPSGPQLGLSGWRSMREKLIETEREQLENAVNPLHRIPVIDGTAAPSIILEESDGYLPASPTQRASLPHRPLHSGLSMDGDDDDGCSQRRRALSDPTTIQTTAAGARSLPLDS